MDNDGLLLACSRVRDPANPKQPKKLIVLSTRSAAVQLMVRTLHATYGHSGVEALHSILGSTYYMTGLRNLIKRISKECAECRRTYANPLGCQMGLLPSLWTTPAAPYVHTGIDFAGPFHVKTGYTRKPIMLKTYACVFICLSTREVHIELCTDLSTTEFLASLRRFIAPRGVPAHIHSDNGTNFVGAKTKIREIQQMMVSKQTRNTISHFCTQIELQWHHISVRAPHFSGIWEAAIKSMKQLLRKVIAPHPLRFDKLYTVLVEVEAIFEAHGSHSSH